MTKQVIDLKESLSIQELEERHELTVAANIVEVGKDDEPLDGITKC